MSKVTSCSAASRPRDASAVIGVPGAVEERIGDDATAPALLVAPVLAHPPLLLLLRRGLRDEVHEEVARSAARLHPRLPARLQHPVLDAIMDVLPVAALLHGQGELLPKKKLVVLGVKPREEV